MTMNSTNGNAPTAAQSIALWADKLRDISAMGLMFSEDIYDRENYQTIQNISLEMMALATGELPQRLEPLQASVFSTPTPFSAGDAAIVNEAGEILLIQRADNHKWAMPGGALSVGETPAEGVAREALEETGVRCEVIAFVGVYDSRYRGSVTAHHLYQYLFLCRPLDNGRPQAKISHPNEVLASGWFTESNLPNDLDPGHVIPIQHVFRYRKGEMDTFFDGQGQTHPET